MAEETTTPSPMFTPTPAEPVVPIEPEKPKAAYVVIEPLEILTTEGDAEDKDHIVATGELTVVMVKTSGARHDHHKWNGVKLPKDAADLSVVEVHRDTESTGADVAVYPNKGEQIGSLPVNDGKNTAETSVGVGSNKPVSFRKMSKALWAVI